MNKFKSKNIKPSDVNDAQNEVKNRSHHQNINTTEDLVHQNTSSRHADQFVRTPFYGNISNANRSNRVHSPEDDVKEQFYMPEYRDDIVNDGLNDWNRRILNPFQSMDFQGQLGHSPPIEEWRTEYDTMHEFLDALTLENIPGHYRYSPAETDNYYRQISPNKDIYERSYGSPYPQTDGRFPHTNNAQFERLTSRPLPPRVREDPPNFPLLNELPGHYGRIWSYEPNKHPNENEVFGNDNEAFVCWIEMETLNGKKLSSIFLNSVAYLSKKKCPGKARVYIMPDVRNDVNNYYRKELAWKKINIDIMWKQRQNNCKEIIYRHRDNDMHRIRNLLLSTQSEAHKSGKKV